jgi:pyrroloquinoline quinone biosynthesis protein B
MESVPHPLVIETIELFKNESANTKKKVFFIHFNHTNPLLWNENEKQKIKSAGFEIAKQGMKF